MSGVAVLFSVLFSLLVGLDSVCRQSTEVAEYSNELANRILPTNESSIDPALGFSQGVIRCWVCAYCPGVRNGHKNTNATSPRWCPVSVDLNASHMCVEYSIARSFLTFGWLVDIFGGRRVRRRWNRTGIASGLRDPVSAGGAPSGGALSGLGGPQQASLKKLKLRQKDSDTVTSWITKIHVYRGCTVYEGFCREIWQRHYPWGTSWINSCHECKGDMCNHAKCLDVSYNLIAIFIFGLLYY